MISLRPALPAEAAALEALVNSAYRGESSKAGWTTEADLLGGQRVDTAGLRDTILRGATRGDVVILVHEDSAGLAACVQLEPSDASCYLGMLTTRPTSQGGGLGRRMLAAAEQYAREQFGAREMSMTVIVQRTELIAWYERRGYQRTGEYKPFPYGDVRFGEPRRPDLRFEVLRKALP